MRPALSDFNACQPCLGAREVSVEVETRDGRLERASPGDGGSRLWLHLYKSDAVGSYDKPGLLSRLSRACGIFNEGGDPGRAGMELLKRFCEIEDGQAAIDNRPAGGAVEDSGVLALLSGGIDDPPAAYLAFRQLADLEASPGAFSQRLTCDPSGLPLWRALRQDPRPGSRLDAAPRGQLPHRRLMRGRPLLKRQINEKLPKPRESARLPQQRDGIKMRWRIDLLG